MGYDCIEDSIINEMVKNGAKALATHFDNFLIKELLFSDLSYVAKKFISLELKPSDDDEGVFLIANQEFTKNGLPQFNVNDEIVITLQQHHLYTASIIARDDKYCYLVPHEEISLHEFNNWIDKWTKTEEGFTVSL